MVKTLENMANKHLLFLLDRYCLIAKIQYETVFNLYELSQGDDFQRKLEELKKKSWIDYVDADFHSLLDESIFRNLNWKPKELSPETVFAKRGDLRRYIMGALRACITIHGPITKDLIVSAAKRISGAVLTWCYDQQDEQTCVDNQQRSVGTTVPKSDKHLASQNGK